MGSRLTWFACGVAAAAVAIGVGEIVAALVGGTSIVSAVGALIISLQPPGAKDLIVSLFGENDKLALEVATVIGGLLVGGLLGLLARRDISLAIAGLFFLGVVAFLLLANDPLSGTFESAATVIAAVVAGGLTLTWLASWLSRKTATSTAPAESTERGMDRRGFLGLTAFLIAAGGVLALVGRYLGGQVGSVTPAVPIPTPGSTPAPVPPGSEFAIEGLTPIVVPNADFYRIDTRLSIPRIDSSTWNLRIHGLVDQEVTLTYADVLAMPLVEQIVTIACVSNEVGGRLVGNARWTGTPLVPILDRAGVKPEATQVVGRSFDGWTSGFPTAHLSGAGKDAMLVVAMNGEPLPMAHGFPARLIVPGLFGYVSATKWITEIELTTLEAFDAYWVPLGWAKEAPILTQSRIDVPRPSGHVAAGPAEVAGIAWAPTRGISRVEVQLDGGDWRVAELSIPLSTAAWVQWRATIDVAPGSHVLMVRATDGTGETQSAVPTPPAPDGARGYHTVSFGAS